MAPTGWDQGASNLPPPPSGYAPAVPGAYGYQPYGAAPATGYAGFGARLGAMLLDLLIIGIPIAAVMGALWFATTKDGVCFSSAGGFEECRAFASEGSRTLFWVAYLAVYLVMMVAYYILPVAKNGQTVGMKIAKIKVVGIADQQPAGVGRVVVRYLVRSFISGAICGLGYFWMLWDDHKQTWHDKAASTIVVTT